MAPCRIDEASTTSTTSTGGTPWHVWHAYFLHLLVGRSSLASAGAVEVMLADDTPCRP